MDIDNKILEMFREKGMMIELGANFSAKGQIAQLLNVVKPLLLEIDALRAYKEAAESQKPSHIIDWEFDDDPDDADARGDLIIHQLNGAEYPAGTPLYANPVPADNQQHCAECGRVDAGTALYCVKCWDCAHKTAVAAPDDWRMKAAEWLKKKAEEQNKINAANPEHTKAYPYWEQKVRELNWLQAELSVAAPSHSQQSVLPLEAAKAVWVNGYAQGHNDGIGCGHDLAPRCRHSGEKEFDEREIRELIDRCPSHDSEQGGEAIELVSQLQSGAIDVEPCQSVGDDD